MSAESDAEASTEPSLQKIVMLPSVPLGHGLEQKSTEQQK